MQKTLFLFLILPVILIGCSESKKIETEKSKDTLYIEHLDTLKSDKTTDSVYVEHSDTSTSGHACDIQLLNSYEIDEEEKVYIFYIHRFEMESKNCWWGMAEHTTNHDVMDQRKYKCVTRLVLDMSNEMAEEFKNITIDQIESSIALKKKTIVRERYCEGGEDTYKIDPFNLGIYVNPIPTGWSPGDE